MSEVLLTAGRSSLIHYPEGDPEMPNDRSVEDWKIRDPDGCEHTPEALVMSDLPDGMSGADAGTLLDRYYEGIE